VELRYVNEIIILKWNSYRKRNV